MLGLDTSRQLVKGPEVIVGVDGWDRVQMNEDALVPCGFPRCLRVRRLRISQETTYGEQKKPSQMRHEWQPAGRLVLIRIIAGH
jgi:hypothetical protein